jgi:hypothetical protein
MEKRYVDWRIVDGKPRRIVVDEAGKAINKCANKEELKELNMFPGKDGRGRTRSCAKYTEEFLKSELRRFEKTHGRPPKIGDFVNNPEYPCFATYQKHF